MKKYLLPLLSIGCLTFALLHVVRANSPQPKLPPPVEPTRAPFRNTLAGSGVVEPMSENIFIGSNLPGIVQEVFVKVGQNVKKGDKLFRLDDRQLRAELELRSAMRTSSVASLEKLKAQPRPEEIPPLEARMREMVANLADGRDQYVRAQRLIRTQAIGEEDLMKRKNSVAMSEAQVAKADADLNLMKAGAWKPDLLIADAAVRQTEAMIQQTRTELDRLTVLAPIDGMILQVNIRAGEYVSLPTSQTLMVLGDVSTLHIRVDIDENDIPRFRDKLPGKAFPRGNPAGDIPLSFVRAEPYVIPKKTLTGGGTERVDTRVLQLIYRVDAKDVRLYVGQQVDVALNAEK